MYREGDSVFSNNDDLQRHLNPHQESARNPAILALPGADVVFVHGRIRPNQMGSHRHSYINAILIHGQASIPPCRPCTRIESELFYERRRLRGYRRRVREQTQDNRTKDVSRIEQTGGNPRGVPDNVWRKDEARVVCHSSLRRKNSRGYRNK